MTKLHSQTHMQCNFEFMYPEGLRPPRREDMNGIEDRKGRERESKSLIARESALAFKERGTWSLIRNDSDYLLIPEQTRAQHASQISLLPRSISRFRFRIGNRIPICQTGIAWRGPPPTAGPSREGKMLRRSKDLVVVKHDLSFASVRAHPGSI